MRTNFPIGIGGGATRSLRHPGCVNYSTLATLPVNTFRRDVSEESRRNFRLTFERVLIGIGEVKDEKIIQFGVSPEVDNV